MQTAPGNTPQNLTRQLTLASSVMALLLSAWLLSPALSRLDFIWLDNLTAWRAQQHAGDNDIVIVDIDDYSLQALSTTLGRWPWPRASHAELVEWLEAQGPKVIVFDIWFSEPDVLRPEFDQYFGEVLAQHHNIYLPTLLMNTADPANARTLSSYPVNLPIVKTAHAIADARANLLLPAMGAPESWHLGLVNFVQDSDGIARHYGLYRDIDGWQIQSMPLILAQDLGFSVPHQQHWRLDWRSGSVANSKKPYTTISYADLWQQVQSGKPTTIDLKGKIILLGSTAAGLHDLRPTPLDAQYPALYLLANTIDNLKNNHELIYAPWLSLLGGILLIALLWRQLTSARHLHIIALIFGAACVALLTISTAAAMLFGWLLPAVSPILVGALLFGVGSVLRYLQERAAHQAAIDMFGRFLDPVVVQQLANDGLNEQLLAGKTCDVSVLFSDIRGFTTMSEKATAAEIMSLLNAYFSRQVAIIFKHHGTLDKFIGDAVMAFWGAPLPDAHHAHNAVAAALDMVDELMAFRAERGLDGFDIGIGIHSGPAVVGMLGSAQRLEYTAIGDTINLGSRLEGHTKGIARILVSQTTRDLCGDAFDFVSHGSCTVKGRAEPVNIYEPRRKAG